MEVHLLTYDLSRGLARSFSQGLLGFHLDAVYHTSIELDGTEWVYDGGIVAIAPGSSHLGAPQERILLGVTELPADVITEYIDSLRPVFTLQAYDLFRHNCNNFSDSLAKFLLGSGIPAHIIEMPQRVLRSPMGAALYQQLMPQVNASRQGGSILGIQQQQQQQNPNRDSSTQPSQHPHTTLDVPSFKNASSAKFVQFARVPPMEKLLAKLGPLSNNDTVLSLKTFTETRAREGAIDAPLPDLQKVSDLLTQELETDANERLFPLVDLLRCALVDPRVSGHFVQARTTIGAVLGVLAPDAPYALRLVVLQMACNLFTTPTFADFALPQHADLRSQVLALITSNLLDAEHTPTRAAAASLAFNLALADRRLRQEPGAGGTRVLLLEEDQAELAASLAEGISREGTSQEVLGAMLSALGHLCFGRPVVSELTELLGALEVPETVRMKKMVDGETKRLATQVERLLVCLA